MKNFRLKQHHFQPGPPDAMVELIVSAIAVGYPGGVLQEAVLHASGRITGRFLDERLNEAFDFEINDGFSFKPSK